MRELLIVIVLIFCIQSWTKADDISNFEIEGLSIGDNVLDFFSKEKLKKNNINDRNLKNTEYKKSCFDYYGNTYDRICISYKKNIIHNIQGQLIYKKKNIDGCKKKQFEVDQELFSIFKNQDRKDWGELKLQSLKDIQPNSYYHPITYSFKENSRVQIGCYYLKNSTRLKVSIYDAVYRKVIQKQAEKR